MSENRKLTRSHNSMLGGVCAGVAEYTGADTNLIRLIVVAATIFGLGSMILVYVVAWVILPLADYPTNGSGPVPPST
ncbi:MAG: PspC domain-containing protein [Actinomycetales bacterium]|nr:PspC domain-containing protein [Actinomycetales bacterium]